MPDYGVKYRIEIGTISGTVGATETYRIDIEKSGYTTPVIELNSSASPIHLNWAGGAHALAPLKPSELTINLEIDSEDMSEFKTFGDQEYLVKIYNNTSVLKWTGFLTSDFGYTEDLSTPPPHNISLKAIDGIGLLQKKEFRDTDDTLLTTRASAHDILQRAFQAIWPDTTAGSFLTYSMLLNAVDGITPWTPHTPTDATNPLKKQFWDQTYFMVDNDTPNTWFDVVRIILRNNLMHFQNGFHTHAYPVLLCFLRHITSTSGEDLTLLDYNNLTGLINTPNTLSEMWTTTRNISDGTEIDNNFFGNKVTMSRPVRFLDVTRKNVNPNMIKGGNFEAESWTDSSTLKADLFESINSPSYSQIAETTQDHSLSSLKFLSTTTKGTPDGVRSKIGRGFTYENPSIGISFKYNIATSTTFPDSTLDTNPEIGIAFICGGRYLQDDLATWEAVENIIWLKVSGDNLNAGWVTENFGIIPAPEPSGEILFEVYEAVPNDYTITSLKWDEINVLEYYGTTPAGAHTYETIESVAENEDLTNNEERRSITLNIMDFPLITISDFSSAVYATTEIEFNASFTDTSSVLIYLDGSSHTFTYKSSPLGTGSKEFGGGSEEAIIDDLILELYEISSNYVFERFTDAGFDEALRITALQYGDGLNPISFPVQAGSDAWTDTTTDPVSPTSVTFRSKASITDSSAGTNDFTPKWYFLGDSTPSAFDQQHWKVIATKYLEHMTTSNETIEGEFFVYNEGADQFGALTCIDSDGAENVYFFINGSVDLKKLTWSGSWRKYNSNSIASISFGDEVLQTLPPLKRIVKEVIKEIERGEGLPIGYTKDTFGFDTSFGGD